MALIGQIREKSGWAIGIVAVGLGLFIVGGDLLSPTSMIMGKNAQMVGEIAGDEITINDFNRELNELKYTYYLNTEKTPGEAENQQFFSQAWNQLIFKVAYKKEFDALGLVVSKEEQIDMVQGKNIHPAIMNSFRNPSTGAFDRNMIINYLQNISRMEQKQQAIWFNFEKNLAPDRLRVKYENLIRKTAYVTTDEAKREYASQNNKVDFSFLFVPYSSVPDNEILLTERDIEAYADENISIFNTDESANLEYVAFPILPAAQDTADFKAELDELKTDFSKSEDDSTFSAVNSENPTPPSWFNPGQLPQVLQTQSVLSKGVVYGPFEDMGVYRLYKIVDIKTDSVYAAKASHILFRWENESDEAKSKAKTKALEILAQIKKGTPFELMARMHGADGTAAQGGDLGWFDQGRMVAPFEKAVFTAKNTGLLPDLVETQFGFHIIKVTETKTNKKVLVATIEKLLTAGEKTRDSVYKKAEALVMECRDIAGLNTYLSIRPGMQKQFAAFVTPSSPYINNLNNPREVLRWAFSEAKEGELSGVMEVSDNFVVFALNTKYKKGKVNLEAYKQLIYTNLIFQKKFEKISEKLQGETSLESAAKKIGNSVIVNFATDVTMSVANLGQGGYEPAAVGAAFGLKPGTLSKPIKGNNGVLMVQTVQVKNQGEVADYSMYKNQLLNLNASRNEYNISMSIIDKANIKDQRYKFF